MEPKVIFESLSARSRLIVTSDIHGRLDLFDALLEKTAFGENDVLVIVGDPIEKGPDSLGVLRRIMELSLTRRVICTSGNVDRGVLYSVLNTADLSDAEGLFGYLCAVRHFAKDGRASIITQGAAELGLSVDSAQELLSALPAIREHLSAELDYLASLPTVVETEHFIFVHGGLPENDRGKFAVHDEFSFMKYDAFSDLTPFVFDKYVVVGHWPVVLYCEKVPSSMPIINREKRIISIDGGCSIKADGQLNAMIVRCDSPEDVAFDFVDSFPKYRALDPQTGADATVHIRWTEREVELLSVSEGVAEIYHPATGRRLCVPEGFLYSGGKCIRDYTDLRHRVNRGDTLSLIGKYGNDFLTKKDGITGWYSGRLEITE